MHERQVNTVNEGSRVRELRKTIGLTLEKFAEPLGVKKAAISNIENNTRGLTDQMIISICREYNVNEDWLRTGEGKMFKERSLSEEVGYYVEDLLEYDGHGNSFYDMIINMMKTYSELDEKSQSVIRNYFQSVADGIHKEEKQED